MVTAACSYARSDCGWRGGGWLGGEAGAERAGGAAVAPLPLAGLVHPAHRLQDQEVVSRALNEPSRSCHNQAHLGGAPGRDVPRLVEGAAGVGDARVAPEEGEHAGAALVGALPHHARPRARLGRHRLGVGDRASLWG